jgi:hypothetical protein
MAWQNEITNIVRNLINDPDGDTYADSRVEQVILVAAQLLLNKVDFSNTYTIDVDLLSLSPDPTTVSPKDNDFINLVSIQAAVIFLKGEAKTLGAMSYKVTDGPSSIDVSAAYKAVQEQAKEMQDLLDWAILEFGTGNSGGQAILTPYTVVTQQSRFYNLFYPRG